MGLGGASREHPRSRVLAPDGAWSAWEDRPRQLRLGESAVFSEAATLQAPLGTVLKHSQETAPAVWFRSRSPASLAMAQTTRTTSFPHSLRTGREFLARMA